MNFKWKKMLLALFVGSSMCFTSCSDDSGDIAPPNPGGIKGEVGYLALNLTTANSILTKAASTTFGETEEAKVRDAYMVLYDAQSLKLEYQLPLTVTTDGVSAFTGTSVAGVGTANTPANANSVSTFTTVAQTVVRKDYKLLVILNPTAAMIAATSENTGKFYKDFEDVKDQIVTNSGVVLPSGLMENIPMTNASGLIDVTEAMFWTTAKEAEEATNLPNVVVDRILAKVLLSKGSSFSVLPSGALFSDASWQLDITNKKTYWVRRMTNTAPFTGNGTGTGNASGPAGPHENTLAVLSRLYVYAEDPNWDELSPDRIQDATNNRPSDALTRLQANFNFLAPQTSVTAFANALNTTPTHEYVLENTMAADEQWEDVTTRILIRAKYLPSGFTGSYYYYGGAAFTHNDIYEMVNTNKPWPTAPTGLKEAVLASGFSFTTTTEPTTSKTDANGKIHFYKDGINYYSILIRHFDDDYSLGDMNFGRYGVVRNNMYKVELNSVTGPGDPTIPEPQGPDDKKKSYISAFVKVLPWVVREQSEDI